MSRKSKCTGEQKVEAVTDYKNAERGAVQICKDLELGDDEIIID